MKTIYLIAAVAIGAIAWKGGRAKEKAKDTITEAVPKDGTNWTADLWSRLNGAADLYAPVSRNADNSVIADPGKVGQASLGLAPSWNGSLA